MAKRTELREKICNFIKENEGLDSSLIREKICEKYEYVSTRQVHNFLHNNIKNGMLYRDEEGKYYLTSKGKSDSVLENKMYNNLKKELDAVYKKYMNELENPFDKFTGSELVEAQKVYAVLKQLKKIY